MCPALFITSHAWVWLTRVCQDLSYETGGVFCYAILCPFTFFLILWKVICRIKYELSFPNNESSYILNVILLLKGFDSMLCAGGCPFPWRPRTMELPQRGPDFTPDLLGECGAVLGN